MLRQAFGHIPLNMQKFRSRDNCKRNDVIQRSDTTMRFLLVEDEPELGVLVQKMLCDENYIVDLAPDLAWAKEAMTSASYELVILDRQLPDGDGKGLVEFAQQRKIETRFLFLTALGETDDLVDGLDLGADDYIVKPFDPEELLARIRAVLRRPLAGREQVWTLGTVVFRPESRIASIGGECIALSRRELSVVEVLMRGAGRVVTRDVIENAVYGYDDLIQSNTLESHISRIRKLFARHSAGVSIHAVRGVGYMLKEKSN